MAGLLVYCARPFEKIHLSNDRQLAFAFQGIDRLSLVFQQLAIASLAVATVTTLDAAVKWPQIATIASVIFFMFAVVRSAAMWWVLTAHAAKLDDIEVTLAAYRGCGNSPLAEMCAPDMPLWDRLAVGLSLGFLVQYEPPDSAARQAVLIHAYAEHMSVDSSDEPLDCSLPQYAFNTSEQKLLSICMASANTASLALASQGFATSLLAVADYFGGDVSEAVSDGINAGHKLLLAYFISSASSTFDKILYTDGCDIGHLMQGIGKRGLTSLFGNLGILSYAITLAHLLNLAVPWIEASPLFTFLAEKTSHEVAHSLLAAQKMLVKVVR
ncbi:hypothetical protein WJX72_006305 [[Myrmecia] bisecta]|uniref:Uncharacterized protein n=1 Tax=[Myrmecia] bisecta TaxID=41462 RepID=A0AAW1R7B8_9CHLO